MPHSIRPIASSDLPGIVALLIQDAQRRSSLDPHLWRTAADAPARVERAVGAALNSTATLPQDFWHVAEHAGRIAGVTHAMIVPVPPIYDAAASTPGLLLDECVTSSNAPSGTAEALLAATEAALKAAGASSLIASCPAEAVSRALYERHGYEPVTLYMAKHRFSRDAVSPRVQPARAGHVPAIVKLSAKHRRTLAEVNPRFWHIHPEADGRFDAWMRRSLTLGDRDMLVAEQAGEVRGYIIAQPCSPLLIPLTDEVAGLGVVDDFYDECFAEVSAVSDGGPSGEELLVAAESAFARRGVDSAIVVCPSAWSSKVALLQRSGYRTAKLWMLKR